MIPKRVFMVWLGDAVPAYARAASGAFKRTYPDYEVAFIRYKVGDLRRVRSGRTVSDIDEVLEGAMREAFDLQEAGAYSAYVGNQLSIYGKTLKNVMLLSDIFRLELLNVFGGIYVDADSVPARPFDGVLTANERFCVCREYGGRVFPDNYFMGQAQGLGGWVNPMDASTAVQVFDPTKRDLAFQYRRARFVKGMLPEPARDFYVEHYMVRLWEQMGGRAVDDFLP